MTFKQIQKPIHDLPTFRFGLADRQSPDEINDFEMADCENVSVEEDSAMSAPGYMLWDSAPQSHPGPYWGGFLFTRSDGWVIDVRQRRGTLEYSGDGIEEWIECTLPTAGSPATTVELTQCQPTFAQLNDILIWTNGYDSVMSSIDGITWTLEPTIPKSKVVFNNGMNRLLYLAQPDSPYRFDWSGINDPLTIGASSYQLVDPNNNGIILGAASTPDGATLVFKQNAIYNIAEFVDDGIIDIQYVGSARPVGHHTIQTTENSVIFALWGDGFIAEYIGGNIRTIAGKIDITGRNNSLRMELFTSAYYNGKYHLSMPDSNISNDYNSQEYIIYKNLMRDDPYQPYVITRNRRYIGCYWIEDTEFDYGRDITLYIGDSRPLTTSGSPAAYDNTLFAWVNDFREISWGEGLDNQPQDCFFTTKYFTENVPYYTKRFKKLFSNFKVTNDLTVTLSYRFLPYGTWTDKEVTMTANELDMIYDDLTEGGLSEGYSFADDTLGNVFIDIENSDKPNGIQFKVSWSQVSDVQLYGMAYQFRMKPKFK